MQMDMHVHHDVSQQEESSHLFCKPMSSGGMTMYMNGFSSSLFKNTSKNQNHQLKPCLNLFFEGLTMDSKFKFILGMCTITCLGIAVEGIASSKRRYISGVKKKRFNGNENEFIKAKIIFTFFQCIQALTGYVLMLSAMTYSIELLLSAVVGLALGSFIFGKHKVLLSKSEDEVIVEDRESPCCNDLVEDDGITYGSTDSTEYLISKGSEYDDEVVESSSSQMSRRRTVEMQ